MKRTGKAWLAVALIVLSSSFAFAGIFDAWGYRLKITFSGYDKSETLTNFPTLVVLGTNIDLFSYADFESEVGGDLRFTASNETTELNYEVEQWDTNSESFVWVQVPELFGTNDFIYAYWGNSSATNPPAYTTNGATWSNGYVGVWHMTETNAQDSTSNAVHGAAKGGVTQDSAGKIDGADSFADNGYIDLGTSLPDLPAFTVGLWWNATVLNSYAGPIQHRISGTNGFQLVNISSVTTFYPLLIIWNGSSETNINRTTSSIDVPFDKFIHFVLVYDGSTSRIYVDGTEQNIGAASGNYGPTGSFISKSYNVVEGLIDEVHISTVVRSSNWVWACWMNQGSNDVFASFDHVHLMSTNLRTRTLPPSNICATNATLNGQLGLNIGGAENPHVYFCWDSTDKGTTSTDDWGNVLYIGTNWSESEGETFSTNITGLLSGSNYHYRCYVTNSTGEDWSDDAESFTTVYLPVITNTGATLVKREAAILQGEITDTGGDTPYVWFYYWIDGGSSTSTVAIGPQSGAFSSKEVDGLIMATNYTYHILASNMAGTVWSGEKSFETLPFGTGTNFWTGEGITDDWFEHANWIVGVPLAGEHVVITNIGKEVLLTNDTVALASFTITNETLTFTNWNTTLNASDVTIQSGGTLTIPCAFTESQMSNRVHIVCSDLMLENGGIINVDSNGYAGRQGPGKGGYAGGEPRCGGGGGYGGIGGIGFGSSAGGTNYGSANAPLDPGSGGGGYDAYGSTGGGGGGAVRIEAAGSVTVNGTITANGGGCVRIYGGGGSGGGIFIMADSFTGDASGVLEAKGGDGPNWGGSGGGGRIAVWYRVPESERQRILDGDMGKVCIITNAGDYSDFSGAVSVTNGISSHGPDYDGEPGTVVFLTLTPPSGMVFMCR